MHFYATNPPIHQVCVIIAIVIVMSSCHGCCHHGFVVLITLSWCHHLCLALLWCHCVIAVLLCCCCGVVVSVYGPGHHRCHTWPTLGFALAHPVHPGYPPCGWPRTLYLPSSLCRHCRIIAMLCCVMSSSHCHHIMSRHHCVVVVIASSPCHVASSLCHVISSLCLHRVFVIVTLLLCHVVAMSSSCHCCHRIVAMSLLLSHCHRIVVVVALSPCCVVSSSHHCRVVLCCRCIITASHCCCCCCIIVIIALLLSLHHCSCCVVNMGLLDRGQV